MKHLSRRRFVQKSLLTLPAVYFAGYGTQLNAKEVTLEDAMDEALEMLARTGPEYQGGLANHGPMAAEAMVAMGRPNSVTSWVERYKTSLQDHPSPRGKISKAEWRESLGNFNLAAEWIEFFNRELKENPWTKVVNEWVTNLAPGLSAAAGHGLLRTAHIIRRLEKKESEGRLRELAEGFGYWAARYQALPTSDAKPTKKLLPSQALKEVQLLPAEQRGRGGSIVGGLMRLDDFAPFAEEINLVDVTANPSQFISNLTETFATLYVENPSRRFIISFIHDVTAPSAIRLLLPHLSPEAKQSAMGYGWQLAAGIYSVFADSLISSKSAAQKYDTEDLIERAIKNGDEHAIKFTEACLREYALNPKLVYLEAARMVSDEL
jgi:hypothetical protein